MNGLVNYIVSCCRWARGSVFNIGYFGYKLSNTHPSKKETFLLLAEDTIVGSSELRTSHSNFHLQSSLQCNITFISVIFIKNINLMIVLILVCVHKNPRLKRKRQSFSSLFSDLNFRVIMSKA